MKITDVRTVLVRVPLVEPATMWYSTRFTSAKVVVFVDTDEGITGLGETRYMEPTAAIIEHIFRPKLIGEDPFDVEKINNMLLGQHPSTMAYTAYYLRIGAAGGVDLALWDIIGKATGQPAYRLLGGHFRDKVPCRAWLPVKSPEEQAKDATRFVDMGWKAFKIKVGANPQMDVECVKAIREAVGTGIEIGIDVNGAWTRAMAIRTIKKMEKYDLSHVEQPVAPHDLDGMAHVRRHVDVPILACDPVLATKYDILRIVEKQAADMINVDPIRAGGMLACKKNCAIAEAAGISVCTHSTEELGIGTAGVLHLVTSTPNFLTPNDNSYHHLSDDIITSPFKYEKGYLRVPEGPGLGIKVDLKKLEKYHQLYKSGKLKHQKGIPREGGGYFWYNQR